MRLHEALARRAYVTLDDLEVLNHANQAPGEFLSRNPQMTIDEVQRSPNLLLAIKRAVDDRRTPGRFILTGSANLLLMKRISETLAGRAVYMTLWPLTRRELLGMGTAGSWRQLFEIEQGDWLDLVTAAEAPAESWTEAARYGGYPTPAYHMSDSGNRQHWFAGFASTYLERDVAEFSAIEHLADFRRLMRACCLRLGNLLNQAELARDVGLTPSTAQRYLNLLEVSYQLVRLQAYSLNRTKRLTKAPKLYWCDTGLAMYLSGEPEARGAHLENLILTDLLAWRDSEVRPPEILYWRTVKGAEVDFVIEWKDRLLPVEVKTARKVGYGDARHLRTFLEEYEDLALGGLLLHTGDESFWLSDGVLAAPWWRIV